MKFLKALVIVSLFALPFAVCAQDQLPPDNGLSTYHTSPRYRASESHPLRVVAYPVHAVGWVLREAIFRPISYFASSSETRRSVLGYREPFDYRQPECFSADDSAPDCRSVAPFNYESVPLGVDEGMEEVAMEGGERMVYFPDVNFDFDKRGLNNLGQGRARQVSALLDDESDVTVVLQGHADFLGSEPYNEQLGMDRAEAVRMELVNLGVDPARLSTVTFGETQPIFEEQTDWARAVNRRVAVVPAE